MRAKRRVGAQAKSDARRSTPDAPNRSSEPAAAPPTGSTGLARVGHPGWVRGVLGPALIAPAGSLEADRQSCHINGMAAILAALGKDAKHESSQTRDRTRCGR